MKPLALSALIALSILAAGPVRAAGSPDFCKITILKVELKDITGKWITAFEGEAEANLVNQQGPTIEIPNDGRVPAADYVNFRVTMSETFVVTGSDGRNRTKSGGEAVQTGSKVQARLPGRVTAYTTVQPTWTADEAAGPARLTIDYDNGDRDSVIGLYGIRELRKRVTIREKSRIRIWLDFDLSQAVRYVFPDSLGNGVPAKDAMMFELPGPREASLQADGQSASFTSADVTLEY